MKTFYAKLLAILLSLPWLITAPIHAQQRQPVSSLQPDCMVTANFTAASSGAQASGSVTAGSTGTTSVIDNRTDAGCLDWLVTYSTTTTVTGLSLLFQTATNVAGVPGTWSAYGGTLITGINPNTAATPPWAITEGTGSKYPFLRMNMTSLTGTGTVSVNLYGWKRRPTYVTVTSGGGCPGTIATPCVVVGPTAAGSAPTTSPVLVAGQDGAPGSIRTLHTDTVGNQRVVGAAAVGAAVSGDPVRDGGQTAAGLVVGLRLGTNGGVVPEAITVAMADAQSNSELIPRNFNEAGGALNVGYDRVFPWVFNGSTWDREYICTLKASVTLADTTVTKIVPESGTTIIRVCHIHMSTTATETFNIQQGTAANCGTGLTTIDKYITTQALAMDFQPTAALRTSASAGLCVSQSGTQAAEVTVIYAQF